MGKCLCQPDDQIALNLKWTTETHMNH